MGTGQPPQRTSSSEPASAGKEQLASHGTRIALLFALAVVTYILFPASPAVDSPIFEVGSIATENVIAPFAFEIRKPAAELARERDELGRGVKPIFVFAAGGLDSAQQQLRSLMDSIGGAADSAGATRVGVQPIQRAAALHGVKLGQAEAEYLSSPSRRRALSDAIRRVLTRWLVPGVAASGAFDEARGEILVRRGSDERSALADTMLSFSAMLVRARRPQWHPDPASPIGDALYVKLLSAVFHPTLVPDRAATELRRQELRSTADSLRYRVREGERIVGDHDPVSKEQFDKLKALREAMQARAAGGQAIRRVAGAIIYNALVLAIFGIAIVLFRPQLYRSFRALSFFAIVFLVVLIVGAIPSHIVAGPGLAMVEPVLVPVAFAAVVLSVLFDPRISMIAAMILAVLVGGQSVYRGTNALFLALVGGAAAALSVRDIRRRDQAYSTVPTIALAYLIASIALGLILGWSAAQIGETALAGGLNALVSVMLAMFLLPLAERYTHSTTPLTLLEYSDLNRPLLRRLSLEAPGTYAHTIAMANLAESACNAIGADGLLARVGTYYHDIGKLKKPQYFVENQPKGRNPHDKLKPTASAAIIRNHVREGLELADENKLPPVIRSFIAEHHGTGSISYFLEKARERGDRITPTGEDFAYPGPIPQTQETAICMLADGVEAAARVLGDPTPEKIHEVIERIVRARMEAGQLREAPLTLRQLDVVKEQFARVLIGMHHNRIDYPASGGGITSEMSAV
ncbi:MAG: HDIG domain-containing protein [Gemmatimonadota bacterium]|nr:HDIG domain-containing protein [Gemmatimonadota bacterium]